ncbi:hypothetical protein BC835DRAFT_1309325 [Cytidiella melzeri]|nr:hypothetical protein BC835DRAFT_1309325 [Cytidiella melzeri]
MTEPGYSFVRCGSCGIVQFGIALVMSYKLGVAGPTCLGQLARWFAAVVIWCISLDAERSLLNQVDKSIYWTCLESPVMGIRHVRHRTRDPTVLTWHGDFRNRWDARENAAIQQAPSLSL